MKNKELAKRIKDLRNRKGFSQEELSEKTGLSLRTIQRIENGETEPRGDSLRRLSAVFDVNLDELIDWTVQEDKGLLTSLNLSALSFMFFPVLGIIVPLIIWISKKDKVKEINRTAREILNFQITWNIAYFIGLGSIMVYVFFNLDSLVINDFHTSELKHLPPLMVFIPILYQVVMYLYNIVRIIINAFNIYNNRRVNYFPSIRFLKS